eukprot:GFUD01020815.1.p1 GENE.GFUD01020815.1~~GFUD01020815.1.p1  ORF type:complete len:624 (-),score=166.21 GFUD01020815.1:83-1954(-)
MSGAPIDLGSLCVVVVVVVCSWGLSLLLSLTCWNSYKKSRPQHLYCTQCSSLQYPAHPIPPLHYQYPSYALPPQNSHYQGLPHTAERLGILQTGEHPALLAPVLQSSRGSYTAYARGGAVMGGTGLEPVPVQLMNLKEEDLDQDNITTISRSFRSGTKNSSAGTSMVSLSRGATARSKGTAPHLTLNERFAGLTNSVLHCQEDANVSARTDTSVRSKLSQVRILTSPPPNEQVISSSVISRTPRNAMRSTRKSLLSNISKRSVKSLLGVRGSKARHSSCEQTGKSEGGTGGARSKVFSKTAPKDIETGALTCETNLETSDEEVFTTHRPRSSLKIGQYKATPVNENLPRQFSQEILLGHKPHLVTQSQGSSGGSDWSNPRKDRHVGSPGNTANAEYFSKQQTPQLVEIDLGSSAGGQPRTDNVSRPDLQQRRRVNKSAPARQAQALHSGGTYNIQSDTGTAAPQSHLLSVKTASARRPNKAYKPGYSDSDFTSQSEDETRRNGWDRRGVLDLPGGGGPSPGSGYDLTPPVLDLSHVDHSVAPQSTAPPFSTTALSTNPSPLQYSSVSFSQSDMSLVVSPARPPTPPIPQYLSTTSLSSHPVSLDWDNYASDPQFQKTAQEHEI